VLAELSKGNPFGDRGCIRDPARFFNRERELAEIFDELRKGSSLSLVGEAQVGKSSLLAMIAAQGPRELQRDAADFITIDMQVIHNEAEFFDALCEKLGLGLTVRGLALDRALRGRQVVVCLDEIASVFLARNGRSCGAMPTVLTRR
jgi:ABC-type dipeptide/oligopeptide/nickel transport system ATPase component